MIKPHERSDDVGQSFEKSTCWFLRRKEGGTMEFKQNEIAAIYVNETVVCTNCMKGEDWVPLTRHRVITQKETAENDKIFFCDRCGEPI